MKYPLLVYAGSAGLVPFNVFIKKKFKIGHGLESAFITFNTIIVLLATNFFVST
jgi:hypothetical protein